MIASADASEQHFSWPELVAHAARDTRLRPGDVLGSGTLTGGCLLELGPFEPSAGAASRAGSSRATSSRSKPTGSGGSRRR